jgi:hypothetical protein
MCEKTRGLHAIKPESIIFAYQNYGRNEKPNSGGDLHRCFPTRISIRIREFYRVLKNKKIKINRPELNNWLSTQNVYTRHKPIVKKFQRNQVITRGFMAN